MDIELTDVHVDGPRRALFDCRLLRIPCGSVIGVAGPSGSGKSTLLHVIAGLLTPTTGAVTWGGEDIWRLSARARDAQRGRRIGLVFQDFNLIEELSPAANAGIAACFAPRADRDALRMRGTAALKRMSLESITRPVSMASGGERQRIAIARAVSTDPEVVLADEPTANLDRETGKAVISDLLDLARDGGKTLIIASHDPAVLSRLPRRLAVRDGRVTEGRS